VSRSSLLLMTALAMMMLQACSFSGGNSLPKGSTLGEMPSVGKQEPSNQLGREVEPYCLSGHTLETAMKDVDPSIKQSGRQLGGPDIGSYYFSGDGKRVEAMSGSFPEFCTSDGTRPLQSRTTPMKREEVTELLGSPTVVKSEGDEFWFYSPPELDEVLVVRLRSAEGFTADEVYVSRLTFAKRQWYPFLGEPPDGSQPLRIADTKLGTFTLGDHVLDNPMNFSEGRTAPYDTHESKALGIKLFSFNGVQAPGYLARRCYEATSATNRSVYRGDLIPASIGSFLAISSQEPHR
jgi:hypothetical protein